MTRARARVVAANNFSVVYARCCRRLLAARFDLRAEKALRSLAVALVILAPLRAAVFTTLVVTCAGARANKRARSLQDGRL